MVKYLLSCVDICGFSKFLYSKTFWTVQVLAIAVSSRLRWNDCQRCPNRSASNPACKLVLSENQEEGCMKNESTHFYKQHTWKPPRTLLRMLKLLSFDFLQDKNKLDSRLKSVRTEWGAELSHRKMPAAWIPSTSYRNVFPFTLYSERFRTSNLRVRGATHLLRQNFNSESPENCVDVADRAAIPRDFSKCMDTPGFHRYIPSRWD